MFLYGIYTYLHLGHSQVLDSFGKCAMSPVIFELDGKEFCAEPGDRLLDLLDEEAEPVVPFACRGANCGVCRVRVVDGAEALEQPLAAEEELLRKCSAQRNERLGCQVWVRGVPGAKRVRLVRV